MVDEKDKRTSTIVPPEHMPEDGMISRRGFVKAAGIGLAGLAVARPALALPPSTVDTGLVKDGKVVFPEWKGGGDPSSAPTPAPWPEQARLGYAIVGLGRLSLDEILPAFAAAKKGRLVALVSGSPEKAKLVAAQYGVKSEAIYDYKNFDRIKDNPDIQAVYIVLPNSLHREFTERAAAAGKHVLCEKPMATSVEDAEAMVAACRAANVKLMIAYRCQYEPYNREVTRLVRSGELGKPRFVEADNSQSHGTFDQWRSRKAMAGGGALPDIGLYCINGARAVLGEEPIEVFAKLYQNAGDPRFKEVEERVSFLMRFPSEAIASCNTSYDAHNSKDLCVRLEKGWIKLDGAFEYRGKSLRVSRVVENKTVIGDRKIGERNQFALEIDHLAECVKQNRTPRTPGEEGVQDQRIMAAIYASAASGQPVSLKAPPQADAFRGPELPPEA